MFRAIRVTRDGDDASVRVSEENDLTLGEAAPGEGSVPGDGSVLVDVEYSSVNYKDGLALAGRPGVLTRPDMIPGIDLVGTVSAVAGESGGWRVGDPVLVNGFGLGEKYDGGLAERARVDPRWLVARPAGIGAARAAAIGTAGFTAMLAVLAVEERVSPGDGGDILVTGAAGGVGSIAIALLSGLGYRVTASTGREDAHDYLRSLGAADIVDRSTFDAPGKPLQSQRWAAAVDSVGSHTLATVLAQTNYGGIVAACGLAQGPDLPATVMPFILRSVTLAGINSVYCPQPRRIEAWARLERDLDLDLLDSMTRTVGLADAIGVAGDILRGEVRGRTVVDVRG
jgi:acrylyl-CoA reductase (NADPH)